MTSSASLLSSDALGARVHVEAAPLPPLDDLRRQWEELEQRSDRKFFLSWSWIGPWLAAIDDQAELIVARCGDEVVGLGLTVVRQKIRHRIMPVWTLFLNQTGRDDQDVVTIEYNDFLLDRRFEKETRAACLRFLIERQAWAGKRVAEIAIGGMDEALLGDLSDLGRPVLDQAAAGSAFVDLSVLQSEGASFLKSLKSSTARRIRRSMKLYQQHGDLELTAASSVDEGIAFFDEAGKLHQARWTERGEPGAFAYPFFIDFHHAIIRSALPEGKVELIRVAAGNKPIGYLYNFVDRGHIYYYFSGFTFETDNRLKPGLVCHALCIQRHLDRGMRLYDFMAGDQRYKLELGQAGPRIVSTIVQRPNWMLAAERPLRRLKQAISGG